jgi:hypothetical protein
MPSFSLRESADQKLDRTMPVATSASKRPGAQESTILEGGWRPDLEMTSIDTVIPSDIQSSSTAEHILWIVF